MAEFSGRFPTSQRTIRLYLRDSSSPAYASLQSKVAIVDDIHLRIVFLSVKLRRDSVPPVST